jgi:hypothetical protein
VLFLHASTDRPDMLWFFQKGSERIHYEIRPAADDAGYELEWIDSQGNTHLVSAADSNSLAVKSIEIEQRLKREGWVRVEDIVPSRAPLRNDRDF